MSTDRSPLSTRVLGTILVGLVALGFMALFYRSYLGISTDGWFFFFATQVLRGEVPYRDFHLFGPPFHVLELTALIRLFGEKLIAAHLYGVLQRVILAIVVFRWLAALYRPPVAALASIVTLIVFSSDIADTVFFYHHDSAFWCVLAGYAASHFLSRAKERQADARWWLLGTVTGLLAGIAFVTKQTTGLGVSVAIPTMLVLILWRSQGSVATRQLLPYGVGWTVPVALVWGWLFKNQALGAYFDQVFLRASAKGTVGQVVLRPVVDALDYPHWGGTAILALGVLGLTLLARWGARRSTPPESEARLGLLAVAAAALVAILAADDVLLQLRMPRIAAAYLALFGSLTVGLYLGWRWLRGKLSPRGEQRLLLAAVSFSICYMFSLSWPAWELMVMPGLALLIAEAVHDLPETSLARGIRGTVLAVCLVLVMLTTASKLETPFVWSGWREPPVRAAVKDSGLDFLAGFSLAESTVSFVETVTQLIQAYSEPDDPVFVFPHLPIFYILAERQPPTFAYVHWFDVTPDHITEIDSRRLLEVPPRVIVNYEISPGEWAMNERKYRSGGPSGQRTILLAVLELVRRPEYEAVANIPAPLTGAELTVWARTAPDSPTSEP